MLFLRAYCLRRNYNVSFRRIAKAIDFSELSNPPAKVCFKKLLMQSRPTIPFSYSFSKQLETATAHSGKCVMPFLMTGYKSPILQRWNLHIRNNYELLSSEKMNTNREIVVSLIIRRPQGKVKDYVATRVINNIEELTNELNAFIATKNSVSNGPKIRLVVEDLLSLPFEEQVQLVGESSIIIGMNGGGMGTSIHMPVGTKYCCGMIEIFGRSSLDSSTDTISTAGFASKLVRGYGSMSKRLGINYAKLEIAESTSETGTVVPAKDLLQALESMLQTVLEKSSCFLPSVLKYPFM